jgi:hypothetical protein
MPYNYGYSKLDHPVIKKSLVAYHELFNLSLSLPELLQIKFSPGGCFAVTKKQLYALSQEYFYHLVTYELPGDKANEPMDALNEGKDPMIGYVFERSWPVVMHCDCWKTSSCRFIHQR